jgi:asparagine synthase (glutamine-hydrolysing)
MSQASNGALKTFSIGFEEDEYTEADEAELSAKHFGAVHHTRIVTGDEVARDIDKFLAACDQPTGDGINTYYASETARQGGVKVALSGLGGDELFGGYPSFQAIPKLARFLPFWGTIPGAVRSVFTCALDKGDVRSRKLADFLKHAHDPHELAALHRRVFSQNSLAELLSPDTGLTAAKGSPFHSKLQALRADVGNAELYLIVSAWETQTYMADVLLRDSDVMSMRHSIELRVPFVDKPLIEWLWRQPASFKSQRGRPKSALVEATLDILPPEMKSRKKRGFTLPFTRWMRGDLKPFIDDMFSSASVSRSGLFAVDRVQAIWKEFVSSGDNRQWSRIWSLAVLIAFVNRSRSTPSPLPEN